MPTGVRLVLFLSGPVLLICYVASSLARGWVVNRGERSSPAAVVEATITLAAAFGTWAAIRSVAPGRTIFQNASAIGFLSSQVLTAWASLALWAGVAAVLGHVAPVTSRFRSGSAGVTGAFVLLVAFLPITALAAVGAWISSLRVTRSVRTAVAVSCVATAVAEWLFAVANPTGPYGLVHGPESALFVAVLGGVVLTRSIGAPGAGQEPQ